MADVGTGATIAFTTTSGYTPQILDITHNDISRVVIDTSHMGLTAGSERTKIPGDLFDAGDLDVEILFDPSAQPPITIAPETITLTFPLEAGKAVAAKVVGTGWVSNWRFGVPFEDRMTATFTITWNGLTGPEWSASSA